MKLHKVKCDECKKTSPLEWNGEHYLHPKGWVGIWCDHAGMTLDIHLCPECKPKSKEYCYEESEAGRE